MDAAQQDRLNNQDCNQAHEDNEILIVSFSNACSKPWTVVIKTFNAAITDSAVHSSWGSVDVARRAILDLGQSGIDDVQVLTPLLFT